MLRRLVIAGLAALLAAPIFLVQPASAAVLFSCDSATGSAVLSPGLVHDKRPQSFSSGPTAPAGPADITLASTTDTGVKGTGTFSTVSPRGVSLSADGTRVAFRSSATDLDPADTDSALDIYVKDLITGGLVLASTSDTGVKGNGDSHEPSLSGDGTKVAFTSGADNLIPDGTDFYGHVYVKDLVTGDIVRASTSETGVKGERTSQVPALSADGTSVAFESLATNLHPADTDTVLDIYVKNLLNGNVKLVSKSDFGVKGDGNSGSAALSRDGTRVSFVSLATNLDPADTDDGDDVYVKQLASGAIALASTTDAGVKGNSVNANLRSSTSLSGDGTSVAFQSRATNLDPRDTDASVDTYVKHLTTGDLTLASVSDAGASATGTSAEGAVWLSDDGTRVAFSTRTQNLDPADTASDWDVYVKDLATGDVTLASTSDNGVKGNAQDDGGHFSTDGTVLAFESRSTNLDPADTDSIIDVYVKHLPTVPTSVDFAGCSNGNSGTASVVDIRSYGTRPLGCPVALGGAAGNDYADTTPILVGATLSMTIDWATGPNSYGVAAAKAGPTGTQWRFRLAITASPGHDTPATNQYLPAAGSGFTKTRLQGKLDVNALDSFNCTSGVNDPLSWVNLVNTGAWVAKTS